MVSADIEGLITAALINEAGLETTIGLTLFRSSGLEKKIQDLSIILQDEKRIEKVRGFDEIIARLKQFVDYRNVFAHGVLIGSDGISMGFFTTKHIDVVSEDNVVFTVKRVKHEDLSSIVKAGEQIALGIRELFEVKQVHEGVPWRQGEKPASRRARRQST